MSNAVPRSYPLGMEAEIFTFNSLYISHNKATKAYDREHVTTYIKSSEYFVKSNYKNKVNLQKYRFTLDTKEDFNLISKIYKTLYPVNTIFSLDDIISLMKKNKSLYKINNHILQKT